MNNVNAKAIKNFQKEFPSVADESWYKSKDGGYIASFDVNSVYTIAAFSSRGILLSSIKYYNEKHLPGDIWSRIKSTYYAYNILKAVE